MSPDGDDRGDGQPSPSLFALAQDALRATLYDLTEYIHATLRTDILLALSSPGKLLYEQDAQSPDPSAHFRPAGLWALLVFYTGLCANPQCLFRNFIIYAWLQNVLCVLSMCWMMLKMMIE